MKKYPTKLSRHSNYQPSFIIQLQLLLKTVAKNHFIISRNSLTHQSNLYTTHCSSTTMNIWTWVILKNLLKFWGEHCKKKFKPGINQNSKNCIFFSNISILQTKHLGAFSRWTLSEGGSNFKLFSTSFLLWKWIFVLTNGFSSTSHPWFSLLPTFLFLSHQAETSLSNISNNKEKNGKEPY